MIQSIKLRNFQVHESFDLELDPGCTTLIGASRRGKSSVLRGLRWLAFNRPAGNAFVRHGEEGCRVAVKVDGKKITRSKDGNGNLYAVDGKKLAAFRTGVPEEIAKLLNLSELNFANQHSNPYWLLSSPSEVSRELNAVVNLDLIDRAMGKVAGFVRKAKGEAEHVRNRLKAAKEDRSRLAWVKEAEGNLNRVQALFDATYENRLKRSRLASLLEKVKVHGETVQAASNAVLGGKKAVLKGLEAKETLGRAEKLRNLLAGVQEREAERTETAIELEKLILELATVKTCPVCRKPMN